MQEEHRAVTPTSSRRGRRPGNTSTSTTTKDPSTSTTDTIATMTRADRTAAVEAILAWREHQRQHGGIPVLPDPRGRRRHDRLERIAVGVDITAREAKGIATEEELAWILERRAHLARWQGERRQRRAIKLAKEAATSTVKTTIATPTGATTVTSTVEGPPPSTTNDVSLRRIDDDAWRGRLRGPEDLRALVTQLKPSITR